MVVTSSCTSNRYGGFSYPIYYECRTMCIRREFRRSSRIILHVSCGIEHKIPSYSLEVRIERHSSRW